MKLVNSYIFGKALKGHTLAFAIIALLSNSISFAQVKMGFDDFSKEAQPESITSPTAIEWSGNPSCESLNDSTDSAYAHIRTDRELKLDFMPPTSLRSYTYTNGSSRFVVGPSDPSNSVTTRRTGNSLNWTSTKGISAIIVKGGANANVYTFPTASFGGNGFTTPDNGANGISHVSFCYYTPATVTIIKEVQTFSGGNASTFSFPFTATNFETPNFSLIDNNSQPADRFTSSSIYTFSPSIIGITESLVTGWTLADIVCIETAGGGLSNLQNTTIDFANRRADIRVEEGECVVCTFTNLQLAPTSSTAAVTGRVSTAEDFGISGARLTLTNASTGATWTALTNQFGFYSFDGLDIADVYILTVEHKRFVFVPNMQSFTLNEDLIGADFVSTQ